ncbi:aminotransferase class I/II-fold pyridoxal phosphate-dependent enzyme [Paraburkholderia panacisoli]|uniref:Aminotransferase class I/II-fold pyridoxal phosphate-dependent enzyme n=1 Tax=Paraburkholderia panacisoli TaxID=2603818 RepID=A0A5B0G8C8_9BURK|nr:aminotransferase class I/II-fold pyridoxal phosphate-dependent enzyme [Paraburkholderia panacisoli]KAA0999684.1 aminotransferase class I/II-fold pyridoxal phosphate-dependent enzyme [Paraburkholderia panacisoli]
MTKLILSERAARIGIAPNAAAKARAQALAQSGRTVVDLTSGEPDFDTPASIKQAAIAALAAGDTKYTAPAGTLDLRNAISEKLARENGLAYPPQQIIASNGGKHVIYNAFAATLRTGDEVIVPAPFWQSFPAMVSSNDGTPVLLAGLREDGYKLTPARLEAAITPRTRWLILNTPSNPSGAVYDANELAELASVLRRYPHVWVLLDEIYEHIRFDDGSREHLLTLAPDLADRTLIVNGGSKPFAMTGWRIGYGAGPAELIGAMTIVQSQSTSAPSSIGQAALAAALRGDQRFVRESVAAYRERRDLLLDALRDIDGLHYIAPQGAFFAFVDCSALIGSTTVSGSRILSDVDFVEYLLYEHGLAVVDGTSFGVPHHIRLSIVAGRDEIVEGARRLAAAVAALVRNGAAENTLDTPVTEAA